MYLLSCSWCTLLLLALFASPHDAKSISPSLARSRAAASLGKSLASLFLVKEGSVPGAKQSMSTFQVTSKSTLTPHQRTIPKCIVIDYTYRHLRLHMISLTTLTAVHMESCMSCSILTDCCARAEGHPAPCAAEWGQHQGPAGTAA